jgi:hypothetical protein
MCFSETVISPFREGGLGPFALAYLMYKLATPARYTITIGGTNVMIRLLRKKGKMPPKSEQDSIRELVKVGRRQLADHRINKIRKKKTTGASKAKFPKFGKAKREK